MKLSQIILLLLLPLITVSQVKQNYGENNYTAYNNYNSDSLINYFGTDYIQNKNIAVNDSFYVNKNIIATTSRKKHKGKLLSVTSSVLLIKKRSSGGSVSMPIKKSKIIKTEVYL